MSQATSELRAEHQEWLNQIRAWEHHLDQLTAANGNILARVTSKEGKKQIEHFENQFAIQKGRLDEMKHNIKIYGGDLEKGNADLNDYREYFDQLKAEFQTFSGSLYQ